MITRRMFFSLFFLLLIPYVSASPYIAINSPDNITYNVFNIPVNISVNETSNITIYVKSSDFDGNLTVLNTDSYFNYLYVAPGSVLIRVYAENENGSDVKEVWFTEFNHTEINVTTCGELTASNHYYLVNDIVNSSVQYCINILSNNTIFDCLEHTIDGVSSSNNYGIYLSRSTTQSTNVTIRNCILKNWKYGIYLSRSTNNTITDTSFIDVEDSITFKSGSSFNKVENVECQNCGRGVHISGTNYNTVYNASFFDVYGNGIDISSGKYNTINNVTVTGTGAAWCFNLYSAYYNQISNSIAKSCSEGLVLSYSFYNEIYSNIIAHNSWWGIELYGSGENKIFNNIINNSNNIRFGGTNYRNYWNTTLDSQANIVGGPYIGGNYWGKPDGTGFSDNCTDSDLDGICDTPYTLTANNIDYLPLTKYTPPQPPKKPTSFMKSLLGIGIVTSFAAFVLSLISSPEISVEGLLKIIGIITAIVILILTYGML